MLDKPFTENNNSLTKEFSFDMEPNPSNKGKITPEDLGVHGLMEKPGFDKNRDVVPTYRCQKIMVDEEGNERQCNRWAIVGLIEKPVCWKHGGQLPNVKKKAEDNIETAKLMIRGTSVEAASVLEKLLTSESDAIKLKAATEILDRSGLKTAIDVNVEVTNNDASAAILEKLAGIAARNQALEESKLEDLGEVESE